MTTERYARLAPDSIRRVANEATKQWSDDSKAAPGLVNDWSTPNSPYIQVPKMTEPPVGLEPRYALLLRSPTVYETLAGGFAREQCVPSRAVLRVGLQSLCRYSNPCFSTVPSRGQDATLRLAGPKRLMPRGDMLPLENRSTFQHLQN